MRTKIFWSFESTVVPDAFRWHCEPARWSIDDVARRLKLSTDAGTDFWQRTHYGFEVDNGHFLYQPVFGDFSVTTQVTASGRHQYDQAGLMLRISKSCWLKTSVEFEPRGDNRLGAVVTNAQFSDWSTQPLAKAVETVWFRIEVRGADCMVFSSLDGASWQQLRVCHLAEWAEGQPVMCGLYACSPKAAGYEAAFHFLAVEPL